MPEERRIHKQCARIEPPDVSWPSRRSGDGGRQRVGLAGVTFGHGIHAGIHWRSDSDTSLRFGEAVALSYLRNRARTYNEPFTINITKFDGSVATISNE